MTHILRALKQKEKSFTKHLTTFEQTLLKARDLKWDDAVKKTFFSNSLNVMLMQALIATSISVLYDEYITLLQQVSYNLKSIQKAVTQECRTMTTIITQQSQTDFMNWEPIKHVSVTAAKTEKKHKTQLSQVCNEIDTQLIISKYKKNTMKRKRRASYRSK